MAAGARAGAGALALSVAAVASPRAQAPPEPDLSPDCPEGGAQGICWSPLPDDDEDEADEFVSSFVVNGSVRSSHELWLGPPRALVLVVVSAQLEEVEMESETETGREAGGGLRSAREARAGAGGVRLTSILSAEGRGGGGGRAPNADRADVVVVDTAVDMEVAVSFWYANEPCGCSQREFTTLDDDTDE